MDLVQWNIIPRRRHWTLYLLKEVNIVSLQVWLPLTKDALNYGVHPSNVTVSNATQNTNGKLGGCYSFSNSAYLKGTQTVITNDTEEWTFACWMKLNATTTGQTLFSCRTAAAGTGITVFYYGSQWIIDDGARWQFTPTNTIATNTWYHICVVRKKGVGKYLYINGVLDKSTTTTGTPTIVNTTNYAIGVCHNSATTVSGNPLNGYLNDIRFYDHALSLTEIKELAKGLVCHYKLDDVQSSDNLIVNGFGELGSENWNDGSKISTTEIPSGHSEIKASFYSGNMTKEYIPISQNHSYTISGYVKAMANQSGTTYPSIWPYDIDKKFIDYHKSQSGFNASTVTTLREPLHKGDKIIYATDLSSWSTSSTNYYFYAAIFGYKNSLGEVYPDLFYTQDAPQFGTYSDKSHIDKTNNTITLNSAFAGEDRPVGTTICQSTQGGTYFYPWNGIPVTSITDWVFKTAGFKPASSTRLRAAKYIRWSTYGKCYIAGNKLVDNFFNDDRIIDSSGYGNHGTKSGNVSISGSTPRYSHSTKFVSGSHINVTLTTGGFSNTYTFSWWGKYSSYSSHMMWGFSNGNRLNLYMSGGNFYWNTGDGSNNPFNVSAATYGDGQWHHFAVTGDGTTVKLYIDGEFKANAKTYKGITGTSIYMNGWDSGTSYNFNGQLSDFRIYATALSADDVKRLYEVSASVSKNGSMLGYEMKEG